MIQVISFRGDRSPVPPRVKIGFESDNLVESLAFELPELAGDQSAMLMISGNAYANMIDLHRTEDGKWAVDLAAEMVGPAGVYESYVTITCPDGRRWNSGVFDLLTGDLPDISGAIETLYPTAVEHVLQEMADTRQEMAASVTASEDAAQRAEDAAQRAENAANQGGGSTAPAKDAVLYTAQELTEEQKTVARSNIGAASVEAVSQLSEEKADKADIPDPYTLPVASADTLGGVKVGNGLRVDADGVLSTKGLEVIRTITLDADVDAIKIDNGDDGLPFALDKCHFSMVAPAGDASASCNIFFKDAVGYRVWGYYMGNCVATDTSRRTEVIVDLIGTKRIDVVVANYGRAAQLLTDFADIYSDSDGPITSVILDTTTAAQITKDSKVTLWGVRSK